MKEINKAMPYEFQNLHNFLLYVFPKYDVNLFDGCNQPTPVKLFCTSAKTKI